MSDKTETTKQETPAQEAKRQETAQKDGRPEPNYEVLILKAADALMNTTTGEAVEVVRDRLLRGLLEPEVEAFKEVIRKNRKEYKKA